MKQQVWQYHKSRREGEAMSAMHMAVDEANEWMCRGLETDNVLLLDRSAHCKWSAQNRHIRTDQFCATDGNSSRSPSEAARSLH